MGGNESSWNPIGGRIVGGCAAGGKKTRTIQPYSEEFLRLLRRDEDGSENSREDHGRDHG